MVVIKLQGGLGNQMFQYAAAKSMALKHNVPLVLDISYLKKNNISSEDFTARDFQLDKFNLSGRIANGRLINKLYKQGLPGKILAMLDRNKMMHYNEQSFRYDKNFCDLKPPIYLAGYFQSESYFSASRTEILSEFSFKHKIIDEENKAILNLIANTNSVALHVRRGDFVSKKTTNEFHGVCSIEYYDAAIAYIKERLLNFKIFVFSDDLQWADENIIKPNGELTTLVPFNNHPSDSWKDMLLMSKCRNHIIANSSFSWWGAWLAKNTDQVVVAPKKWFNNAPEFYNTKDLIPDRWTTF